MKFEIVVGHELDSGSYPDALEDKDASTGIAIVGPAGLVGILETRLGLSKKRPHPAVRISQYCKRLKEIDDGKKFFSRSFQADAWSTAKLVLSWRDELRLAGWNGGANQPSRTSDRLKTSWELENSTVNELDDGLGDRLQHILDSLAGGERVDLDHVRLVETRDSWAAGWKDLFERLDSQGTRVTESITPSSANSGDIGFLREALVQKPSSSMQLNNDGALCFLTAPNEWEACETLASLLHELPTENHKILVIRDPGSNLLDETLHRHNLPRLGYDSRSRWRTVLQVLPLVLGNNWEPLDPQGLLEFLMLPVPLLPNVLREPLARIVREFPGINSPEWSKVVTDYATLLAQGSVDSFTTRDFGADFSLWTGETKRYAPNEGIPSKVVQDICGSLKRWAGEQGGKDNDELLLASASIYSDVSDAVRLSGLDPAPQAQLNRILDSVIGEGLESVNVYPEAGPWSLVNTPGQIWGPADTIIWWNFSTVETPARSLPWTNAELQVLDSLGVKHQTTKEKRLIESMSWRNAVNNASQRLILVAPESIAGEAVDPHLFLAEIRYCLDLDDLKFPQFVSHTAKVWKDAQPTFCGTSLQRKLQDSINVPPARTTWSMPKGVAYERSEESFSSLSKLIECPLAWVFQYVLKLQPGALVSLPHENQMLGTLCHTIIEKIFSQDPLPSNTEAETLALQHFDDLVPRMAASLRLPEQQLQLQRVREIVRATVTTLLGHVTDSKLKVAGLEVAKRRRFRRNQTFYGRIDMILGDAGIDQAVLDLKWSRSSRYKTDELRKGQALQLAAYAWLLEEAIGSFPPGGYYLLAQKELIASDCNFFRPECVFPDVDLKEIWTQAVQCYDNTMKEFSSGDIHADCAYLKDRQVLRDSVKEFRKEAYRDERDNVDKKINFCAYANLCGQGGEVT